MFRLCGTSDIGQHRRLDHRVTTDYDGKLHPG